MDDQSIAEDFTPIAVTLRDGRRATLRSIRAGDADALQAAIGRLSAESRYMRFMSALNDLSPSMLKHAVHPVAGRDLALVTPADPAGEGAGGTRLSVAHATSQARPCRPASSRLCWAMTGAARGWRRA